MKTLALSLMLACLLLFSMVSGQNSDIIRVDVSQSLQLTISVDAQAHEDYGFAYPLTFKIALPGADTDLQARVRHQQSEKWTVMDEKYEGDFFNAEEVVRFDYDSSLAYVSVGFRHGSDKIYIQITDAAGITQPMEFKEICPYYDNRDAAMSMSADDMAGWSRSKFEKSLGILRDFHIWTTCAINTNGAGSSTYRYIQQQLDLGYVEAGCHSRTHPNPQPYNDYEGEITGNRDDIINNLDLPPLFRNGQHEYVYSWIAPHGYLDAVIDSIVGADKFLVNRLYYDEFDGFPEWNDETGYFKPIGVTREVGPLWVGTHDSTELNKAFDDALARGSVYYLMCHPNVIEWDKDYTWSHFNHISNRPNVWYVALGHLFLYHLAQENYVTVTTAIAANDVPAPQEFKLQGNYPNPFNPVTTISYSLAAQVPVKLQVYNYLGQLVRTLVSESQAAGPHSYLFDGADLPSGVYFYRLEAGGREQVRKMTLLK